VSERVPTLQGVDEIHVERTLARYDAEFGHEVEAVLRKWADQTEQYERDGSTTRAAAVAQRSTGG
jgi:hypothetical protein